MNFWKLLLRSLAYYRKLHLWVILGTMISTAVLVGAFIIGDSVRYSLKKIVENRLGRTEFALASGDRFFRSALADDLSKSLGTSVAPLLLTRGIAVAEGGLRRINGIQVVGVDGRFGEIGGTGDLYGQLSPDEVVVNRLLASRLGIGVGDDILIRIQKLDIMPRDAPLSLDSDATLARRYRVKALAGDSEFGWFNLKADQLAPSSVFVSLSFLSQDMGFSDRANALLVSENPNVQVTLPQVNQALHELWTLADAGIELKEIKGRQILELKSTRVFLEPLLVDAALNLDPTAQPVLTYFVNEIRLGERATPYSFVAAPGSPILPPGMKDDEIVINDWLAGDVGAAEGDTVHLSYFVLGPRRDLEEKSSEFKVKSIVPLQGVYADRELLPDFPGLADQENCRDWNPGIPIDLEKIRDKDEDYWDNYRGTPKAFVTLNAAQKIWVNRFGNLTAVRFMDSSKSEIEKGLKAAVDPGIFGFVFREVKKEGLQASSQSVDFTQLFLGLSFFIVIAALLLTGLLFVFNTERRSQENGLYLALGFSKKTVKKIVLSEGAVLIAAGSLLGSVVGVLYNFLILAALKTVWQGAVGTSSLRLHLRLSSLVFGVVIGIVVAFLTVALVSRKQIRQSITGLQKGLQEIETVRKKKPKASLFILIFCFFSVFLILFLTNFGRGEKAVVFFFAAGTLLLVGGIAWMNVVFFGLGSKVKKVRLSPWHLGVRNTSRKRLRSTALIGLLASGLFIVFTVGANRINALKDAEKREAGTGGFALYGESAIPVLYDLNSRKGRQFYGLEQTSTQDVSFVQFRVKEGDDASCLNLNAVANPQLIGVDPEELGKRRAFTFAESADPVDPQNPWSVLEQELPDGSLPAIADQSVIIWGLNKAVGDSLPYLDEKGETFQLKLVGGLANSIFQGSIIISERAFIQKFPSISGYRIFLVDVPVENRIEVAGSMSWAMEDQGLDLIPASARLAEFNTVQNTYLSIFLILGSFGLLLGSIGLGIVVWRNVKERQGELALLRAIGFSRQSVKAIVLFEHISLLMAGIVLGIAAALLATLPSLLTPGGEIPYPTILIIIIIVSLNGGIWTYSAASLATREDLIPALRKE